MRGRHPHGFARQGGRAVADALNKQRQSGCLTVMGRKVIVSRDGVESFNRGWPASKLRSTRAYWFEFDSRGDLVDTDVPEQDDGPEASAMADDCKAFLLEGVQPDWCPAGRDPWQRTIDRVKTQSCTSAGCHNPATTARKVGGTTHPYCEGCARKIDVNTAKQYYIVWRRSTPRSFWEVQLVEEHLDRARSMKAAWESRETGKAQYAITLAGDWETAQEMRRKPKSRELLGTWSKEMREG